MNLTIYIVAKAYYFRVHFRHISCSSNSSLCIYVCVDFCVFGFSLLDPLHIQNLQKNKCNIHNCVHLHWNCVNTTCTRLKFAINSSTIQKHHNSDINTTHIHNIHNAHTTQTNKAYKLKRTQNAHNKQTYTQHKLLIIWK